MSLYTSVRSMPFWPWGQSPEHRNVYFSSPAHCLLDYSFYFGPCSCSSASSTAVSWCVASVVSCCEKKWWTCFRLYNPPPVPAFDVVGNWELWISQLKTQISVFKALQMHEVRTTTTKKHRRLGQTFICCKIQPFAYLYEREEEENT